MELAPVTNLKADLLGARRKHTRGGVTIDLVRTADGRHSDYAPSVAMAMAKVVVDPVPVEDRSAAGDAERRRKGRSDYYREEAEREAKGAWRPPGGAGDRGPRARWRPSER